MFCVLIPVKWDRTVCFRYYKHYTKLNCYTPAPKNSLVTYFTPVCFVQQLHVLITDAWNYHALGTWMSYGQVEFNFVSIRRQSPLKWRLFFCKISTNYGSMILVSALWNHFSKKIFFRSIKLNIGMSRNCNNR